MGCRLLFALSESSLNNWLRIRGLGSLLRTRYLPLELPVRTRKTLNDVHRPIHLAQQRPGVGREGSSRVWHKLSLPCQLPGQAGLHTSMCPPEGLSRERYCTSDHISQRADRCVVQHPPACGTSNGAPVWTRGRVGGPNHGASPARSSREESPPRRLSGRDFLSPVSTMLKVKDKLRTVGPRCLGNPTNLLFVVAGVGR